MTRQVWGLGADPAARHDFFAVALMSPAPGSHGSDPDAEWILHRVSRWRGVELDEMHQILATQAMFVDANVRLGDPIGVAIDATGIGAGPAKMLHNWTRRQITRRPIAMRGVQIAAGESQSRVKGSTYLWTVSRQLLIGELVMAIQSGRVNAKVLGPEQRTMLREEMEAFRRKPMPSGRERLEHSDKGHDDILFACSLAMWICRELAGSMTAIYSPVQYRRDTYFGPDTGPRIERA